MAVILLENGNNLITMAFLEDDEHYTKFKTLLSQVKPLEVVFDPEFVNAEV